MISVCMNCGELKKKHLARCRKCNFKPRRQSDIAKSIYLSKGLFTDKERAKANDIPPDDLSEDALKAYAEKIKNGENVLYDKTRMSIIRKQKSMLEAVSTSEVLFNVFVKFLWPCWAVIFIAILLYFLKQ